MTDVTSLVLFGEPQPVELYAQALDDRERARAVFQALCGDAKDMRSFVLDGIPRSKARPRFDKKGHAYTDEVSRAAERATADCLRLLFDEPLIGNVAIGCVFYRHNRQRIDADNMMKHVLDAATGICWADDCQVTGLLGIVEYDPDHPRTIIVIGRHTSSMDRSVVHERACAHCGVMFDPRHNPKTKCCSLLCSRQLRGVDLSDPVPCPSCGELFKRAIRTQKTCSKKCGYALISSRAKERRAAS